MDKPEQLLSLAKALREFADRIERDEIEVLELSRSRVMGDPASPEKITITFHERLEPMGITSLYDLKKPS